MALNTENPINDTNAINTVNAVDDLPTPDGARSPFLDYFSDLMPRMHELMDKEFITGATLVFPTLKGDVGLHFTGFGMLMTMGDAYSSKLIGSWDTPPVLHNIGTDDVLGPVEFVPADTYGEVQEFMKRCGTLHLEVMAGGVARIVEEHYAAEFHSIDVGIAHVS